MLDKSSFSEGPVSAIPEPAVAVETAGHVEEISKWGVHGWVDSPDGISEVQVELNGFPIATTFPARPMERDGETLEIGFARSLTSIWPYLGKGDVLTFSYGGRPLTIQEHGLAWIYSGDRPSRSKRIIKRINTGYVINKYGKIRKGMQTNLSYKDWIFVTLEALRNDIKEIIGCESFPFYGSMLGAVREGDFIGHDNDFDMIYISKHTEPESIKAEYYDLCSELISLGYLVKIRKTHAWIIQRGTKSKNKIDVFFGWYDKDGYLQVSNGYHHDPVHKSVGIEELVPYPLAGHEVLLPVGAEAILGQLYGPNWRIPDRGFKHRSPTLRVDQSYWLNIGRAHDLYWKQFYRDHAAVTVSPFARRVAERIDRDRVIVEIGCGSGGDACFLAEQGHQVVAIDRNTDAIALAQAHQESEGVEGVTFSVLNAYDQKSLDALLKQAAAKGPLLVYLRFYLHAVSRPTRTVLYKALSMLPVGSQVAMEFRTEEDKPRKQPIVPQRWYLSPADVIGIFETRGFRLEYQEIGRGLSPHRKEDPHLARLIVRKVT